MAEHIVSFFEYVMYRMLGAQLPPAATYYRSDWSDIIAIKAAREVLKDVAFPSDRVRRSLYAKWLRVFASNQWDDSFDGLMLDCIAATPSPTAPETPLFANIFETRDPIDTAAPRSPVLNLRDIPKLFARKLEKIEPLPSAPGFVDFMSALIRKSRASQAALDEAGLIIGFVSLALSVVAAKPWSDVQDFFRIRMKVALANASVPLSFEGDIPWPSSRFLTELFRKVRTDQDCVIKPYIVLLVLGQYAYHVNATHVTYRGTRVIASDKHFLEEAFLTPSKFGHLEVVELLYKAQEKLGVGAPTLNRILCESGDESVSQSSQRVDAYLEGTEGQLQSTRPWCRVSNSCFFNNLDLVKNVEYALRLTALVAPDPNSFLWQREEFTDVPGLGRKAARIWARDLKRALAKGKYGGASKKKP
ncbi:uncharacterized protein LOC144141602 [Haemaphysalis longicornis]